MKPVFDREFCEMQNIAYHFLLRHPWCTRGYFRLSKKRKRQRLKGVIIVAKVGVGGKVDRLLRRTVQLKDSDGIFAAA